jgi:signal transduction histidine kinase
VIGAKKQNQIELKPIQLEMLYKRHFQGALVRSGASLFMWLCAFVAFLVGSIQDKHLIGVSLSVAFLICINPPTLWLLKHSPTRRRFEYISLVINFFETIGYTAIIYVLGGINALFLSPIYAALIAYVGVVGPPILPFKIAGFCGAAFSLMVVIEYFGIIPHQIPFWKEQLPGSDQIIIVTVGICLLYVVAFISSYTGKILKHNEAKLKEQNTELSQSRLKLKQSAVQLENKNIELELTANQAQESDRMKSEFLANMSHELRTPLNHIIGFTELIVDKKFGDLTDIQEEYLNDVLQSSNYLLSLINDILDLSRVEAGKFHLVLADVNIHSLMQNSLNMVKEKARKHKIQLSLRIDPVIEKLKADERRLKQVMYNLLSNAVKFTPDGGAVDISAKLVERKSRPSRRRDDAGSYQIVPDSMQTNGPYSSNLIKCVEFIVSDTGVGINTEDQKRIFNRFEQADGSIRKKYKGSGLGLSLCKNLVELHGGHIWAVSEGLDKGCSFRFVIPA